MDKFITFETSGINFNYFFTKNHFLLLLISLVIIIFFSMYFTRQKTKVQKVFVFFVGIILIGLEGARLYWRYKFLEFNGQSLNFFNVVNLDFYTLTLWISLPLIIIGSFIKKKKQKHNVFGLTYIFNITMLAAIITLIYPDGINTSFDFYHCYNLIFTMSRSLIIMLGLFFAFAKWIFIAEFLDLWKAIFYLIFTGGVCFAISHFLAPGLNLFYVEYCPIFESLGIYLSFPWHLLLLGIFLFVFQLAVYVPFRFHRRYIYKRK